MQFANLQDWPDDKIPTYGQHRRPYRQDDQQRAEAVAHGGCQIHLDTPAFSLIANAATAKKASTPDAAKIGMTSCRTFQATKFWWRISPADNDGVQFQWIRNFQPGQSHWCALAGSGQHQFFQHRVARLSSNNKNQLRDPAQSAQRIGSDCEYGILD